MFSNQFLIFILGFLIGCIFIGIIIWIFFSKKNNSLQVADSDLASDFKQLKSDFDKFIKDQYETKGANTALIQEVFNLGSDTNKDINSLKKSLTTGSSQIQGQWGQTTCENILKEIGFKKGREYESQKKYLDANDKEIIPDFVIHLPEDRHYILDSKVSIQDWHQYINATDEETKRQSFKNHISSVLRHIKELREAGYSNIKDIKTGKKLNTGEFILMYMPIENSFQSLSEESSKIKEEAFKNNITIVGPSLLHLALRIIDQMWSIDKQAKNTSEAIKIASNMYTKASNIVSSFKDVKKSFNNAQENIETASKQIESGKGNFISLANKFRDTLGIISSKRIMNEKYEKDDEK